MTQLRKRLPLLLVLLTLVALALPAPAGLFGKKGEEKAAASGAFELRSQLLARDPDVAEALSTATARGSDPVAWDELGRVLADKGAFGDAAKAFERAVALDPESNAFLSNRGAAYLKLGENRKALSDFKRALDIEPFDAVAYYNLGVAHDRMGRYDEALAAYQAAFQLDRSLADPEKNPAVVNNEHMMAIGLRVYAESAGSTPAIYQQAPPGEATDPDDD